MSGSVIESIQHKAIYEEVRSFHSWSIEIRRWIHQHPELLFREYETSAYIQEQLKKLGVTFTAGWGKPGEGSSVVSDKGTGIVAEIGTGKPPCVALRADIDALPIQEKTGLPFASQNGNMHACGHDAHVTILLGIARYLKAHEKEIEGTFRLIFQPAEEGGGGASFMIKEGCLSKDPPVQAILGLHVFARGETGKILGSPGVILATASSFRVKIVGLGGHASMPHLLRDPVSTAAAIIQNVNTYIARRTGTVDMEEAGVISIASIKTQDACNVIPSEVELRGTIRALSDTKMQELQRDLDNIVSLTAKMYNQTAKLELLDVTYPVTANDPTLFEWCDKQMCISDAYGKNIERRKPYMGSEDFSYYGHHVPACFFFLGAVDAESIGKIGELHSNTFTINEDVLPMGQSFLAYLARRLLLKLKTDNTIS